MSYLSLSTSCIENPVAAQSPDGRPPAQPRLQHAGDLPREPGITDDDDRRYRTEEELEQARQRDPIETLPGFLVEQGFLTEEEVAEINAEARRAVNEATDNAEAASLPDVSTFYDNVYAP